VAGKVALCQGPGRTRKSLLMKEIQGSAGLWVRAPSRRYGQGGQYGPELASPQPEDKATTGGL
jgi:hypothetical protein